MVIFERDIAVDLGTCESMLYVRGKGIMVREPTIVAVDKYSGELVKIGKEAQKTLGRTPANIVPINPIVNSVISDYDMTVAMLKDLVSRITSFSLFKPRVLVTVPGTISGVEERALIDAVIESGARKVYLVESSVATAFGAGVDITKPDGHLVIDIGGGTTDVAVVSMGGVAEYESTNVAGREFDDSIIRYLRRKHNLLIGEKTAEDLKISIGSMIARADVGSEEVKGRDLATGLPKSVSVSSSELAEVFIEPAKAILECVHMVLERTPPELMGDISQNGIVMSGGGSLIFGFDKLVEYDLGIRTMIVDDPVSCAVYGGGKMLLNLDNMQDGMMNFSRKRRLRN